MRHRTWAEVRSTRYTDTCLVIGPNLRWTEMDFRDLWREKPEVFLGYRIKLVSPNRRDLRGHYPKKVVSFDGPFNFQYEEVLRDLRRQVALAEGIWEHWYVHRGHGTELLRRVDYRGDR